MRHFNVFGQEILVIPLSALRLFFLMPTLGESDITLERFWCAPLRGLAATCCVGMWASNLSDLKHIYLHKCFYHMLSTPEKEPGILGSTQPRTLCPFFRLNNEPLTAC